MVSERKLVNRKKRFSKGRAVRVSDLVYETLDKQRRGKSWDVLFRKLLGLPDRAGNPQTLVEGMLEATTGMFLLKLPGATWSELEETAYKIAHKAAERKRSKRIEKPLRMRELA